MQPGLILDQPLMSMQVNSFQLIKFSCTRTDSAAETKSIGLQADARVVMVFAMPPRLFYRDTEILPTYQGPGHLDCFIVTLNSQPLPGLGTVKTNYRDPRLTTIYRDWQKTRHLDTDGNSIKPPGRYS